MDSLYIDTANLPESEREPAHAITVNYLSLQACVDNLAAAVDLFDHCLSLWMPSGPTERLLERRDHNMKLGRWHSMAARGGAIAIYEFYQITQAIGSLLSQCPTLSPMIDKTARKEAGRLFEKSFPEFASVRLFAAHGQEMVNTPAKAKEHATSGGVTIDGIVIDAGQVLISGTLINRKYVSTHKGKTVSYDLTPETVQKLADVLNAHYRALAPIGTTTGGLPHSLTPQRSTPPQSN